jgi:crotonobetainyl-CoA:carnitine CoA-transferase CaiB-like acyl-CoA transferase
MHEGGQFNVDGGPLDGFVVVDLTSQLGGAYCTKLLVDAGAQVIKLEPPDGDPLRRRSASRTEIPRGHDSAIFRFLAASKQSVVIDPAIEGDLELAARLIGSAGAVVWTPGTSVADHPSLAPQRLAAQFPSLIVTAITPFGLDGPWAGRPASDLTLQAWAGGVWARGVPERAPVAVGGGQDQWASGIAAAASTLLARIGSHRNGRGGLVDVSALEALAQWLFGYGPMTSMDIAGRPLRDVRSVHIPGVEEAKDGWVGLMVGTAQQWFDFCAMVGHPEWTEDPSLLLVTTRSDHGSGIAPAITEWTSQHTVEAIRELASAFQIPNSPIGNGSSIPTFDHFVERGSFVENPHGGFLQPVSPYRLDDIPTRPFGPAPDLGADTARLRALAKSGAAATPSGPEGGGELPLAGVRVLDLTSLFAGPFFTRVMGMFGAEVIHLESISRPDLYRMYSLKQVGSDEDWCEWTPQFSCCNTNKKDLTLDLQTERGRDLLLELVATCDVVVENFSTRVMENLRLDYDTLRGTRDDLIMVRMPGFGVDGPWRDVPAFAPIIEDAAGITWMTGYPDDKPQEAQSVGDPNAALHALTATLLALEHRRRTGKGACVEASMVGAALNIAAEQVVEFGAYGKLLTRSGNRNPLAAPQGLYRSSEKDEHGVHDLWVAIATENDEQWSRLRRVLGDPEWARDAGLDHVDGRLDAHDLIDEHLDRWCAARTRDEIVDTLWSAGVPVAKVVAPHEQGAVEQLVERGFFEVVEHPVMGAARYDTFSARFSNGPRPYNRTSGPLLGEHNDELLSALGCTAEEIARLTEEHVIGRQPRMGWSRRAT